ncbi:MAG: isochorismatase family cysteine hydrolase [Xenococcaceae cyanobacterium MO_188.B32]|nr:isochorismatase family cysteine hydrolase [Xenococcaceae cyanobacterium MO_188.B32]
MVNQQKSALIVIDLQNDFTLATGKTPACTSQVDKLIPVVNKLSKKFIKNKQDVAYLKTEWSNPLVQFLTGNSVKKGTKGADFDRRLNLDSNNIFIKKNKNAFSSSEFIEFLKVKSIDHLYLVGLATDYCIKVSAEKAIENGYRVTVVRDGVAAYKCEYFLKSLQVLSSKNCAVVESANID